MKAHILLELIAHDIWTLNFLEHLEFKKLWSRLKRYDQFEFLFFSNLADFTAVGMPSRGVPGARWTDYRKFVKNKHTRGNFVTL